MEESAVLDQCSPDSTSLEGVSLGGASLEHQPLELRRGDETLAIYAPVENGADPGSSWCSVSEAGRRLGRSEASVRRLIHTGKLSARLTKTAGHPMEYQLPCDAVEQFAAEIQSSKTPAATNVTAADLPEPSSAGQVHGSVSAGSAAPILDALRVELSLVHELLATTTASLLDLRRDVEEGRQVEAELRDLLAQACGELGELRTQASSLAPAQPGESQPAEPQPAERRRWDGSNRRQPWNGFNRRQPWDGVERRREKLAEGDPALIARSAALEQAIREALERNRKRYQVP